MSTDGDKIDTARPDREESGGARRLEPLEWLVFLIPALQFLEIHVGGRLLAGEAIILLLLPLLIFSKGDRILRRDALTFIVLCGLWLAGQVVTDVVRGTPPDDFMRGWARIVMTIASFSVLMMLLDDEDRRTVRIHLFVAGLVVGNLLDFAISPERVGARIWKYGLGFPTTLGIVAVAGYLWHQGKRQVALGLLVVIGIVNFVGWKRSLAGWCLLTAFALWLKDVSDQFTFSARKVARLAMTAAVFLAAGYGLLNAYTFAAKKGWLGKMNKQLYSRQSGELGILLGGRIGVLATANAIRKRPIIGHGSWAEGSWELYVEWERAAAQLGYGDTVQQKVRKYLYRKDMLMPSHSILLGSWAHAGIAAVPVWLFVLWWVLAALVETDVRSLPFATLIVFFGIMLSWHVLFSPYGIAQRQQIPYCVAFILMARQCSAMHRSDPDGQENGAS